jgi:hypothetical protein
VSTKAKLLKTTGFGRGHDAAINRTEAQSINVLLRLYAKEPSPGLLAAIWEVAELLNFKHVLEREGILGGTK